MFILISIIPAIILNLIIANAKGKSLLLFFVLSIIPVVNGFAFIYLLGCTNELVLNQIQTLKKELENIKSTEEEVSVDTSVDV